MFLHQNGHTLNLEDNLGNVYTFGATNAITQLTGDVNAVGPGSVTSTIESIQGNSISGTTGTINVVFSHSPTLTGTITAAIANFSGAISASNFSGSSNGTNTGDVTLTNTNSIDLAFSSGQTGLSANLNLSSSSPDAGYISTTPSIKSDGLFVEIVTGTPVQIGTSNNPGSANSVVYSDHVHSHGAQTDPTLHAIATDSTNGFMSSSDKTKLDSISGTLGSDAQILISNGTAYNPKTVNGDINITDTGTTTIQPNVVSNSKLAQAPANTLKGNNTGVTANVTDLTVSQVNTMLGTVTTIGTYDSQTSQANGLDIVGNTLYAQSATTSNPGMVNATTQSFAGNKTFTGTIAIALSSTSALTINTSSFIFDSTNDVLGIGLQPSTSVMIDGINTTGSSKLVQMTGYGVGSTTGYRGRFARGTSGSPSAVQSGDILNVLSGRGYGTSQFATASTGAINVVAGETFTNASNLTYLQFQTTPTGSVTTAESMRIASNGITLGPQSSSTAVHQINGGLSGTTNSISSSTYTLDSTTTDYIVYTNSTSNAITLTLPAPTNGRILVIEDKSGTAGTNNITVDPHASETINGKSSFVISQNYGSIRITSDGTNWFIQALPPNVASTITPVIALTESGGATTINWATGNVFTLTLNANLTVTFSNATAGQTIIVRLTNTASNYTVTWPTVRWPAGTAPTMSAGAVSDVYTVLYDGSNYYGSYVQDLY